MATFTADPGKGVDFTQFSFADLVGNTLVEQSATTWHTKHGLIGNGNEIIFHGFGLTYTGGSPTGGALTELQRYESGALSYSITGFSVSAAAFQAYRAADDIQGFVGQIFNGNDNINGSGQTDWLYGYNGHDVINGNGGSDLLDGGAGNDSLYGGGGLDVILGQAGNDLIDGGSSNDWVDGGAGNDTYYVNSTGDLITETLAGAAGGTDKVYSSASLFTLQSNLEQLYLSGASDIDGNGNSLNNTIVGNAGDNRIDGGGGVDTMTGAAGNDIYIVDNSKDVVTEGAGAANGFDTVQSSVNYSLAVNVEQLVLTGSGDINGNGNVLDNYIQGTSGDNVLNGDNGKDTIFALAGDDTVNGGLGDDTINGYGGDDSINVSQGNDRVLYTSQLDGHDVITTFDGNAAGGQDVLDLDWLFDTLGIATNSREDSLSVVDNGATVDILLVGDDDSQLIVTLNTADAISAGQDILLGSL